jgi:alpha-beta hydrolase superfamily lysophospholipase
MCRLSVRRLAWGLLLGLLVSALPPSGRAADTERVKFDTVDQVELHGTFYPSTKGNKAPTALLLHALGGSSEQEGWADLAKKLQDKGFAVLTFDFRGHGESTAVGQTFWSDPANQKLRSFRPAKLREQISYKDFSTLQSWFMLLQDITAAKNFLDRKNDSAECNSGNIVMIGAESGAAIGALWIWDSWQRRKIAPTLIGAATRSQYEGQDIACAVWLSITPTISVGGSRFQLNLDSWLRAPVREKVPMYFIYGEQDVRGATYAKHLCDGVLRAERDSKLKLTGKRAIKDTRLAGRELLGKPSLNTEDQIITYALKVVDDRGSNPWSKRDAERMIPFRIPVERYLR